MEISGFAMDIYKESLSPIAMGYLGEIFQNMWTNSILTTRNDNEIIHAMCFFQDIMQHGNMDSFNLVYPVFMKNCLSTPTKNQDIIHNTVFGFGLIAQRIDSNMYPSLHDTLFNVSI